MFLVFLCSLAFATLTGVRAQGFNFVGPPGGGATPCVTPQGGQGQCVLLNECPSLFSLFRQSRTLETRRYLEQLTCGQSGRYPKVCCEDLASVTRPPPRTRPTPRVFNTPRTRPTPTTQAPVSKLPMVEGEPDEGGNEGSLQQHRNFRLLPLQECGLEFVSKIYGGNDTALGEFPWAALLEYEKNGKRSFECGGALINQRYVLTAAHCTNKGTIGMNRLVGVRLGEHDRTKNPDCEPDDVCKQTGKTCPDICADEPIDYTIEEEIVHPGYRSQSRNQYNDIALLRLSSTAPSTGFIRPICIPTDDSLARKSYVGTSLTATGWGRTTEGTKSAVKLKADLPAVSNAECAPIYQRSRRVLNDMQMCAGGISGVDVCSGDSGGPLMSPEDVNGSTRFHVTGIVSFGSNMCHYGTPGVYTRVAPFSRWILDQLRP